MVHCSVPLNDTGKSDANSLQLEKVASEPVNASVLKGRRRHCVPAIPRRKAFGRTTCVYYALNHFVWSSFPYTSSLWHSHPCSVWWRDKSMPKSCELRADTEWMQTFQRQAFVFEGNSTIRVEGFNHLRGSPLYARVPSEQYNDLLSADVRALNNSNPAAKLWANSVSKAFANTPK